MPKPLDPCVFAWDGITDPTLREPVRYCDNCKLREDHPRHCVLTLWQRDPYGPFRKHLGSWPLASIKKWSKTYR